MDNYKHLIEQITVFLKQCGYTKKGNTFYRQEYGNLGLIDLQKSKSKSEDGTKFTINLGVFSSKLWELSGHRGKDNPDITMCHWRERIGSLFSPKKDHWWLLSDHESINALVTEIENIIRSLALPAIQKHLSDADLIEAWFGKEYGGLTNYMRLYNLITLMKLAADPRLPEVVKEYKDIAKGRTMEQSIKDHLHELNIEA